MNQSDCSDGCLLSNTDLIAWKYTDFVYLLIMVEFIAIDIAYLGQFIVSESQ